MADRHEQDPHPVIELTADVLRSWPIPLDEGSDKFARGSVLVVGGSARTPGAVELAGLAALRAGAGRLQLATVESVAPALSIAVPEALVEGLPETADGAIDPAGDLEALDERVQRADAVLFGPGLEDLERSTVLLERVLAHTTADAVVVVDALGLACLAASDPARWGTLTGRLVLTPNRTEGRDLDPGATDDVADGALAAAVARSYGATVAVHGQIAAADGRTWHDGSGCVGLATSGSGDVLAGLIAGVAARCGDGPQSACWGSRLHGAAGRRLSDRIGPVGFLARDIAAEAPHVLAELTR